MTAVAIPFLRLVDGNWAITWPDHLQAAKEWRRRIKLRDQIPTAKELHGIDLASGRGNYLKGKHILKRPKAGAVYRAVLADLHTVIPDASVISVVTRRGGKQLYGHTRLEAALHALFQRMRQQCRSRKTNALVFFDEGHPEYRRLYRNAQVYLPTGSKYGAGITNAAMTMFVKDGN